MLSKDGHQQPHAGRLSVLLTSYQCQLLTFVASALSSTIHRGSPSPHFAMFLLSTRRIRSASERAGGRTDRRVKQSVGKRLSGTLFRRASDFVARRNYWKRNYASHLKRSVWATRLVEWFRFLFAVWHLVFSNFRLIYIHKHIFFKLKKMYIILFGYFYFIICLCFLFKIKKNIL